MFESHRYNSKYYNRHLTQYRIWENAIGKYIFETMLLSSIIDLGCGVGSYLEGAFHAGCKDIVGIDISFDKAKEYIVEDILPHILYGDITKNLDINRTFDCVLSFEVAEHIEPEGTNKFIENLTSLSNNYIIFTAASSGQGGTGHINLREKDFWIKSIVEKEFSHQEQLVQLFGAKWKFFNVPKYILKNLMIFKK